MKIIAIIIVILLSFSIFMYLNIKRKINAHDFYKIGILSTIYGISNFLIFILSTIEIIIFIISL